MRSSQMKLFVIAVLKEKLSPFYYYHNCEHSLYVMEKAIEIGAYENCTEQEIDMLTTAALWHDSGFINTYYNHEKESCLLARQYLPGYAYSPADIDLICGMIMATKMPQSPQNKLETIIADADLEYLGTNLVEEKAGDLFKELQHRSPSLTEMQWHKTQISFLQAHHYFTQFCKEKRAPLKQAYLQKLMVETM
ncbi:MAG: phosphohydrolase [Bacteroidota bacterium]